MCGGLKNVKWERKNPPLPLIAATHHQLKNELENAHFPFPSFFLRLSSPLASDAASSALTYANGKEEESEGEFLTEVFTQGSEGGSLRFFSPPPACLSPM